MFTLDQYTSVTGKHTLPQGTVIRNIALPYPLEYRVDQHDVKRGKFRLYSQSYDKKQLRSDYDYYGLFDPDFTQRISRYCIYKARTNRYTGKLNPMHWEIVELPAQPLPVPELPLVGKFLAGDSKTLKTLTLDKKRQPTPDGLLIEGRADDTLTLTRAVLGEDAPLMVTLSAKIETPFQVLVSSANAFIEWLATFADNDFLLSVALDQNKRIQFKSGNTTTHFNLGDLAAYLEAHHDALTGTETPKYWVELPYAAFRETWAGMATHASKDREILNAIYTRVRYTLDGIPPQITFAAADGYRLAIKYVEIENYLLPDATGELSVNLLPSNKGMAAVLAYPLDKKCSYTVRLYLSPDNALPPVLELREDGQAILTARPQAVEGRYPNFEGIIPTKNKGQACLYNDELQHALNRALPYLDKHDNPYIKLECTAGDYNELGEMRLYGYSAEKGDFNALVTTSGHEGENITITVNARNLLTALQFAGKAKKQKATKPQDTTRTPIMLQWQGAGDPLVIKLDDYTKVAIMPVRSDPDVSALPSKVQQSVTPAPVPSSVPPAPAYVSPFARKAAPMPTVYQLRGAMGCQGFKVWRLDNDEDHDLMPLGTFESAAQALTKLQRYLGQAASYTLLDEDGAILYPVPQDTPPDNGIESTPYNELDIVVEITQEPEPLHESRMIYVAWRRYEGQLIPLYRTDPVKLGLLWKLQADFKGAKSLTVYHAGEVFFKTPAPAPEDEPTPSEDTLQGILYRPHTVLALDTCEDTPGLLYAPRDACEDTPGLLYAPRDGSIYGAASHKLPRLPRPVAVQIAGVLIVSSLLFGKVH